MTLLRIRINFYLLIAVCGLKKIMDTQNLKLIYTLLCDDVRLEMGNKLSMMGVFQNIMVEQLPVSLIKFAVVNHWRGEGIYQTEVRILSANKTDVLVASQPTNIELASGGFTDNVSFFVNVVFSTSGTYWVQTLANSILIEETSLTVTDANTISGSQTAEEVSETVN